MVTDLASSKQISCHHVEDILKFPKSLMVILLYLFSFIKKTKQICRDTEDTYVPLVEISCMGHIDRLLVTLIHTVMKVAFKFI